MNLIKGYRNMLNLTQKEIADILGISRQSYYLKEKGYVPFNDHEKLEIKNLFLTVDPNITIDKIFFTNKVGK
ncbi:helix-turn-helix transcriptional regulator [Aerococcus urinae]